MSLISATPGVAAPGSSDTAREPANRFHTPDRSQSWDWVSAQDLQGPGAEVVGGGASAVYSGAGVWPIPHPDRGLVDVTCWWPFANVLKLYRVNARTRERTVVRGASLITVAKTRQNNSTNPDLHLDATGYLPGLGSPTVRRAPDEYDSSPSSNTPGPDQYPGPDQFPGGLGSGGSIAPKGWLARVTASATGATGVYLAGQVDARPHTVAMDLVLPQGFAISSSAYLRVEWSDVLGGTYTPTTVPLSDLDKAHSIGRRGRPVLRVWPPPGATVGQLQLVAQLAAGDAVTVRRLLIEPDVNSDGSYFDGDVLVGTWSGTRGASTSLHAAQGFVLDGEAPVETPIFYEMSNPDVFGGLVASAEFVLDAPGGHYDTWLTHPLRPYEPRRVWVERAPTRTRAARVTYLQVIGSEYDVAISNGPRAAASGDGLRFITTSIEEREALRSMFDDQAPIFVRMPGGHGYGDGFWAQFEDETEEPRTHWGRDRIRPLTYPYREVGPPVTPGSAMTVAAISGTANAAGVSVPPVVAAGADAPVQVNPGDVAAWVWERLQQLGYRTTSPGATREAALYPLASALYRALRGG